LSVLYNLAGRERFETVPYDNKKYSATKAKAANMTKRLYLSFPDCRRDNKSPLSNVK
jgi:hypothetical protein